MAINWDFNEPWPCAAGNSLVNWPTCLKPAYYTVKAALRPTIASIRTRQNRYIVGEEMNAEVWVLNDSSEEFTPTRVKIYLENKGEKTFIKEVTLPSCAPRINARAEVGFTLPVTDELDTFFGISLECAERPEINSTYKFIAKKA
jgi:beta-mannosidase